MARTYAISSIAQSAGPGTPAQIILSPAVGNVTASFSGKFWRNSIDPQPPSPPLGYLASPGPSYRLIQATTFEVIDNPSYAGRYTVYSPVDAADATPGTGNPSSQYVATKTVIRVAEAVGLPTTAGNETNTGSVTNISTYIISIAGEASLVIPPSVIFSDRPMEVVGRNGTPWGESYAQNFVQLAQNFAGAASPANPYLGQTWYDDALNTLNLRTAAGWTAIASGLSGSNTTARVTQSFLSDTWVVPHNLSLAAPFVCLHQVFVDVGGGVHKQMLPSDVTFDSANQLTITFSSPQQGVVLLRA